MEFDFYPRNEKKWVSGSKTFVRGNGFIDGELHETEDLFNVFDNIGTQEKFKNVVRDCNGFFAVVRIQEDDILIASDRIRSIPIFYGKQSGRVVAGTDSEKVRKEIGVGHFEATREAEYIVTGYVIGNETLDREVCQTQAGEIVTLSTGSEITTTRSQYYRYRTEKELLDSEEKLLEKLDDVLVSSFKRLIQYANGRPIVVSMSGGYDSRLVITMLKRLDYEPLIAVTYAYSEDERDYCRSISEELNLEWLFVKQTHDEWREWYGSDERKKVDQSAGIIDTVPTIGPAIAIKKLSEKGHVPDDAIFVTGDSASTTGEHLPPELIQKTDVDTEFLVDLILSAHYQYWEWDSELDKKFRERIRKRLDLDSVTSQREVADAYEIWDWKERQAKLILRTYLFDFWNYDFWYPLWDQEFMDFWSTVPLEYRFERSLYEEYVQQLYADESGLSTQEAAKSFHERSSLVSTIEKTLAGTPIKKPAEQFYQTYISPRKYGNNPIWGIMTKEQFDRLQSGRQGIHAFRVLEVLDRMSFHPPEDAKIARSRELTKKSFSDR